MSEEEKQPQPDSKYNRRDFLIKGGALLATLSLGGTLAYKLLNLDRLFDTADFTGPVIHAAFGKTKITPEESVPLAGYSTTDYIFDPKKDGSVLDDIYARIMILKSGTDTVVIVNMDCCLTIEDSKPSSTGKPSGTLPFGTTESWAKAGGTTADHTHIFSTHTHTAPLHFGEKYISRIADEIQRVAAQLTPVQVKLTQGECSVSVNRRPKLSPNFSLPLDRNFQVISFEKADGRLLGAIVNAAVHPTVVWNKPDRISSDIVGLASQRLEQHFGNDFVSLFTQGYSGDIGPLGGGLIGEMQGDSYAMCRTLGDIFFYDVMETLEKTDKQMINPLPLATDKETIKFPTKPGSASTTRNVTLSGIRLGELVLFASSLEVFNGYVAEINKLSPFKHTVMSGLTNGYSSYLPSEDAFQDQLGGYEMQTTPYDNRSVALFKKSSHDFLTRLYQSDEKI